MGAPKHTPGPWVVAEHTRDILTEPWGEGTGQHEVAMSVDSDANATLIAAAPDLLEVADAVLEWAKTPGEHGGNPYFKEFVRLAVKAKVKAEGGTSC